MILKDVMTKDVITVSPDDTLEKVLDIFSKNNISGAPVTKDGKVVGIISESDILKKTKIYKLIPKDAKHAVKIRNLLKNTRVRQIMTIKVYHVRESDDISKAVKIMNLMDINRLPVLSSKNRLVGIVTRGDIINALAKSVKEEIKTVDFVLETDIDRLLRLVEEKKQINLDDASRILKVKEEQVEEWGKILEEQGLIKLNYPAFGKPILQLIKKYVEEKP